MKRLRDGLNDLLLPPVPHLDLAIAGGHEQFTAGVEYASPGSEWPSKSAIKAPVRVSNVLTPLAKSDVSTTLSSLATAICLAKLSSSSDRRPERVSSETMSALQKSPGGRRGTRAQANGAGSAGLVASRQPPRAANARRASQRRLQELDEDSPHSRSTVRISLPLRNRLCQIRPS